MYKSILATGIFIFLTVLAIAQTTTEEVISTNPNAQYDSSKKSINAVAAGKIGAATVTIHYHSPGVRNRVIWGGLVPNNEVWVTGAHSATTIDIDKPFMVGDKKIAAGKYALFTIPGADEWTIILNTNYQQHLADDYNSIDDVVRIIVKPVKRDSVTERLQYFITDKGNNKGTIAIAWEKLKTEFGVVIIK